MKSFPLNWISKYIPDDLYISSVVTITKGEDFAYTTASKSLAINNLTEASTASLLKTINTFVSFGSVEELNNTIGGSFVNALIGKSDANGFAYSLYSTTPKMASDFSFQTLDNVDYFKISKNI